LIRFSGENKHRRETRLKNEPQNQLKAPQFRRIVLDLKAIELFAWEEEFSGHINGISLYNA
jgi:hypothetical protein